MRSNLASVQVLSFALTSKFEQIRLDALKTLIHRGGPEDMAAILERIDQCNEAELPLLMEHIPLLKIPIEAGLADRNPIKRQRSLCAIAKLQIGSLFRQLVLAAESPDDPQQMVAAELLMQLSTKLGDLARRKKQSNEMLREHLQSELLQSMRRFQDHRITDIVDAWLCATNWNDTAFKAIFTPASGETIHKIAVRQMRHSHRPQIVELMAGILWSQGPTPEALKELGSREDQATILQLAVLVSRYGMTSSANKNLNSQIRMSGLEQVDFSDNAIPLSQRCNLLKLLSASCAPPDKVLLAITQMLELKSRESDQCCAAAIRNMRCPNSEMVVMVLSDCFEVPGMESYEPPPWKVSLRTALERLIQLYPSQSPMVQRSIEFIFADFRCEELIKHLEDWPESHLNAYAKIVRIAETGYVEFIQRDAASQSAVKRSKAIQAVRFLGVGNGLKEIAINAVSDKNSKVRTEAIFAIASGYNRRESIEILRPLLKDEDQTVITAANFALSQLEV